MVAFAGGCYPAAVDPIAHTAALEPPALVARVDLAYEGTHFHGWQVQPGGLRTVQGELVKALERLVPLRGLPPGAGRTDTGVHARGQVSSVVLPDAAALARVQKALPRMVPPDMAVVAVREAEPGFHARFGACGRVYRYRFTTERDPFLRRDHLLVSARLDREAMAAACATLIGDHDATSLCRSASLEPGRTLCRIRRAEIEWDGPVGAFTIEADRFLHSTVRIVVGTLLEVGRGMRPVNTFETVLAARDRRQAGATAPAHGLCLEQVHYYAPRASENAACTAIHES